MSHDLPALHAALLKSDLSALTSVLESGADVESSLPDDHDHGRGGWLVGLPAGTTPVALVDRLLANLELRVGVAQRLSFLRQARELLVSRGATCAPSLEQQAPPGPEPGPPTGAGEPTDHHRRISELAAALADLPGRRVKIHLLRLGVAGGASINRIGGVPLGVPLSHWPAHQQWVDLDDPRQAHLISIDAAQLEVPVPDGARAISLFIATPSELDDTPVTLLAIPEAFLRKAAVAAPPADAESRVRTIPEEGFDILPAISLPLAAFLSLPCDHNEYLERWDEESAGLEKRDEDAARAYLMSDSPLADLNQAIAPRYRLSLEQFDALDDLQPTLRQEPYIGGAPLPLQAHLWGKDFAAVDHWSSEFFMQFGEEIANISLGDAGILCVGATWSSWDCH